MSVKLCVPANKSYTTPPRRNLTIAALWTAVCASGVGVWAWRSSINDIIDVPLPTDCRLVPLHQATFS